MNFAQKAASTVVSRMLLEMDALPKGSGNVDQVMALVGTSNAILKGIEELRDTNAGTELELGMAQVQERPAGEKDPLEGMSESKVDFDNPVPVPSLVAAVKAVTSAKKPIAKNFKMRVRVIDGARIVSLAGSSAIGLMALPSASLNYTSRMPNALARIGDYLLPESVIGPLFGYSSSFFSYRNRAGIPCHAAYVSGQRRYIKVRDAAAYFKNNNLRYGLNAKALELVMQAISNN